MQIESLIIKQNLDFIFIYHHIKFVILKHILTRIEICKKN